MIVRPLRLEDFEALSSKHTSVPSSDRGFRPRFITPNILASGHFTLGLQIWEYPSFRLLRAIKCGSGYVSTISPFPDAPLVAIANDIDKNPSIYNYLTGEEVWRVPTKIAYRSVIALGKNIVCFYATDKRELHAVNISTKQEKTLQVNDISQMIFWENNKFVSYARSDVNGAFKLRMFKVEDNMNIVEVWLQEMTAKYEMACLTRRGIMCRLEQNKFTHFSWTGELISDITLTPPVDERDMYWNTLTYVHDDLLLYNGSEMAGVVDLKTNKLHPLRETSNGSYLHRVTIHPYNSVIVAIRETQFLDVYRLLPDISPSITQMQNKLLACGQFYDLKFW